MNEQIARLWKLTRRDGVALGFTDHDHDIEFEEFRYETAKAVHSSEVSEGVGFSAEYADIAGALSNEAISENDLRRGLYEGARVELCRYDWEQGILVGEVLHAEIGSVNYSDHQYKAELRSPFSALEQNTGRVYERACSATLGDKLCGADLTTMTEEVSLLAADGTHLQFEDQGWELGWFEGGFLNKEHLIRRDNRQGGRRFVELWDAVDLMKGEQVQISVGCQKSLACCRDRFRNAANFRGFPHMPDNAWFEAQGRIAESSNGSNSTASSLGSIMGRG